MRVHTFAFAVVLLVLALPQFFAPEWSCRSSQNASANEISSRITDIWDGVDAMWNSIADNDFDAAIRIADKIKELRAAPEGQQDKSRFPDFAAAEVRQFAAMSQQQKRDVVKAFRAIRAAGYTGMKSNVKYPQILEDLSRAERLLHKTASDCPNTYCRIGVIAATHALRGNSMDLATSITSRMLRTSEDSWGGGDERTAAMIVYDISFRHCERLPDKVEFDRLKTSMLIVGERGLRPDTALSATSLLMMCEVRDKRYDSAIKLADAAKAKYVDEKEEVVQARNRVSMLRAQALAESGKYKDAVREYESIPGVFVEPDLDHRGAIALAFDAVHRSYINLNRAEEAASVLIGKRRCIEDLRALRLICTFRRGWVAEGVVSESQLSRYEELQSNRVEMVKQLKAENLVEAQIVVKTICESNSANSEFKDWYFDLEWIADDIQLRLSRGSKVTRAERRAIANTWQVLDGDQAALKQLLADREKLCSAIEANQHQDSAGAFYLRLALAASFLELGRFDEARMELTSAREVLRNTHRETGLAALCVSRLQLLIAIASYDTTFDLENVVLPSEVNAPLTVFNAHHVGEFCNLLAGNCYLRGEYKAAIRLSRDGAAVFDHDQFRNRNTIGVFFFGLMIDLKASFKLETVTSSAASERLDELSNEFTRLNCSPPRISSVFYENAATLADDLQNPKKAESLRLLMRKHLSAIGSGPEQ